jgi:signal transduction histidine kinase
VNQSDTRRRNRRIFLLVLAILIPAAVLITLAVRVVRQETELGERRAAEERRDALDQLRRELSARLQSIKLQEVNRLIGESGPGIPAESPIVFVIPFGEDRMALPWEKKQSSAVPAVEFTRHQLEGESFEFRADDAPHAIAAYTEARDAARKPIEKCEAQLWLGRAFSKAGMMKEAADIYHAMLEKCEAITDDDGIPLGLYASERLISSGQDLTAAGEYVIHRVNVTHWRPPNEAYLLRSLLNAVSNDSRNQASVKLSAEIHDMEQIMALANDGQDRLVRLKAAFRSAPGDLSWIGYGDDPWLITVVSPTPFARPVVMAVSSARIVPAGATLTAVPKDNAIPLGEGFVDVEVLWPAGRFAPPRGVPGVLYAAVLILTIGATLLAAYLLLRDVNREVQMAEMRSHFVASVSHELKTPLTAIRMFAETLVMGRAGGEQQTSEYLRTIVNESERLSRLVDNVLDFSRIEQGNKVYRMQPTCLADVARSAARTMQYPLSQLGFTLTVLIDENIPSLQANADALEQAILNLLANAMKYSGSARQIEMRIGSSGDEAFIDIVDHGLGISREDQSRIFEKFYRVRSSETDPIAGTGLGLTLALHIVEAHKGQVRVTSEVGHGSTFSVRIPMQEPI